MFALRVDLSGASQFDAALQRFGENITDATPIFEQIADMFARRQEDQFASEMFGRWAPLSPRYAAWKNRNYPGQPILTLTGALRRSMTQRPLGVEEIGPRKMTIGTDVSYAIHHQRGAGRMPARPMIVSLTNSQYRQIGSIMHEYAFQGVT